MIQRSRDSKNHTKRANLLAPNGIKRVVEASRKAATIQERRYANGQGKALPLPLRAIYMPSCYDAPKLRGKQSFPASNGCKAKDASRFDTVKRSDCNGKSIESL